MDPKKMKRKMIRRTTVEEEFWVDAAEGLGGVDEADELDDDIEDDGHNPDVE